MSSADQLPKQKSNMILRSKPAIIGIAVLFLLVGVVIYWSLLRVDVDAKLAALASRAKAAGIENDRDAYLASLVEADAEAFSPYSQSQKRMWWNETLNLSSKAMKDAQPDFPMLIDTEHSQPVLGEPLQANVTSNIQQWLIPHNELQARLDEMPAHLPVLPVIDPSKQQSGEFLPTANAESLVAVIRNRSYADASTREPKEVLEGLQQLITLGSLGWEDDSLGTAVFRLQILANYPEQLEYLLSLRELDKDDLQLAEKQLFQAESFIDFQRSLEHEFMLMHNATSKLDKVSKEHFILLEFTLEQAMACRNPDNIYALADYDQHEYPETILTAVARTHIRLREKIAAARLAILAEEYRIVHGKLPVKPSQLDATKVNEIVGNRGWNILPTAAGIKIYLVGPNQKDDAGRELGVGQDDDCGFDLLEPSERGNQFSSQGNTHTPQLAPAR